MGKGDAMSEREEIAKMYDNWMGRDGFRKTAMASAMVFWAVNNAVHPADLIASLATSRNETQQRLDDVLLKAQYPT